MRLLLALFLLLLATQAGADACADQFRAGASVYTRTDRVLTTTEEALYFGLGWVNRANVLTRLENRSAITTACDEVAALHDTLTRARAGLGDADQAFRLAGAFCLGENRSRAQLNVTRVADLARAIDTQITYLDSLRARCRP